MSVTFVRFTTLFILGSKINSANIELAKLNYILIPHIPQLIKTANSFGKIYLSSNKDLPGNAT